MTVRQVITEIEALPPQEQMEVFSHLQGMSFAKPVADPSVRYVDPATARPLIREILTEHAELFRKLAQ